MPSYPSDRRARAARLVAEGRFGGARYGRLGGRPAVKGRAGEVAAQLAAEEAERMIAAFVAAMAPEQPIHTRLRAVHQWLKIVAREDQRPRDRQQL